MAISETPDLLRRTQAGDRAALEELLARHLPKLRAFVRLRVGKLLRAKESSSDIVQSVCADLLEGLDRFDYRGEARFRGWLYTAVLHKIREHDRYFRAGKRDAAREVSGPSTEEPVDFEPYADLISPSRDAIGREMAERLEQSFEELPEAYREIITLSRIVGLSHDEAAQEMGRTVDAVRNLLHRALVRLSAILDRQAGRTE